MLDFGKYFDGIYCWMVLTEVMFPLLGNPSIIKLLPPYFGLTVEDGVKLCQIHCVIVGGWVVECD